MRTPRLFLVLFLLVAVWQMPGQTLTGAISGTITDASGAIVPHATVTVTNADTGVIPWRGTSNELGIYSAPALPVGSYRVRVELAGFKKEEVDGIRLLVGQRARVDVSLTPGEVSETVTVVGEAMGRLEAETSSMGTVINTNQLKDLPMPSRNVLNLLTLVGGVSSGGAATGISGSQLSINGSRTLNSEFTVDGVSTLSGQLGSPAMPSTEILREVSVLTAAYSAEYGRTSGGYVNAVTQSGTNELHGGLYEYFQNEKLNANNFFNNLRGIARPRSRSNELGGKVGGPVWIPGVYNGRERTFFFFNYVRYPFRRSTSTTTSTIPDEMFRTGDFSNSPVLVYDPLSGAPFAGNRLPSNRIDSAARRVMGLLPASNSPGSIDAASGRRINNFVNTVTTIPISYEYTARVDHSFGSQARIYGRATRSYGEGLGAETIPGPLDPGKYSSISSNLQGSMGYTHIITPTLIVEARIGANRLNPQLNPPNFDLDVPAILGIQRAVGRAVPRISVSGFTEYGYPSGTLSRQVTNTYNAAASATWVRGGHTMKFGFQLRKSQFNVFNAGSGYTGTYAFDGSITSGTKTAGNPVTALADFLLGHIKTSSYTLPQPLTGRRSRNFGLFLQDDWKITRRLTMNVGLRYEYESPIREIHDLYSRVSSADGRLLVAGKNASSTLDLGSDRVNFGPRLGFAYSVNDKTVVRSAFGIFYSMVFNNLGGNVQFPGFTVTQTYPNLGVGVPQPFTLSQGHPIPIAEASVDPFAVERAASPASPLSAYDQFGEVSPLPSSIQWNWGIQRALGSGVVVDLSYVGSRGTHLPLYQYFNQVPFERGEEVARDGTSLFRQMTRMNPNVNGVGAFTHAGTSSYHSLQLKGTRQFTRGLAFMGTYTFSKSIDDGSGLFGASLPNGLDRGQFPHVFGFLNRSVSAFDRPHNVALALQYTTPGPRILRGWEISPIFIARDGLPQTIRQNNLHPSAGHQQRPSVINTNGGGYAPQMTSEGTAIRYLLPTSDPNFPFIPSGPLFTGSGASRKLILPFVMGNLGRNTMRAPGEVNLDLSVGRRFKLHEKLSMQVRAEAFNALNHTNLNGPNTALTVVADSTGTRAVFNAPSFGLITSAKAARFMQLVLRLDF